MLKVLLFVLTAMITAGCTVGAYSASDPRDTDPASLTGRTWQWESTQTPAEKITPMNPEGYTLRLTGNGRFQARFDCNKGGGSYQISTGKLSFGPMMSTRMACAPDSLDSQFMRDLGKVESFFVEEGHLYLGLQSDSGTMRLRPVP